ncbi:MAG: hypothetical protein ACRC8S_07995 [Fimbriiglobus sp.]
MYGVPADLDLSFLIGAALYQVHLMPYQLNLVFDPDARFFVEGDWELVADGVVVDRHQPWPRQEPYHWHRVLDRRVVGWSVSPPKSLAVEFEGGLVLRLYDSSEHYESFLIEPGCIVV